MTKHLSITRHSFRGVTFFNSQKIILSKEIMVPNPFITWNKELTEEGIKIVQIKPINNSVQKAYHELNLGEWDEIWDEIRVDFLNERTFRTGYELKKKIKRMDVRLNAVIEKQIPNKTYSYDDIDYVVHDINPDTFPNQVPGGSNSYDPDKVKELTFTFLNYLSLSLLKKPFTEELPQVLIDGKLSEYYYNNIYIATIIFVMSSPIPPMNRLYDKNKKYCYQKEIVQSAMKWLLYSQINRYSLQYRVYMTLPIIEYYDNMNDNSANILVTHEGNQLFFLSALGLAPYPYNIPFQSYIIIENENNVIIMFTAPQLKDNGTFNKDCFVQKQIWKGTKEEWRKKIKNLYNYVDPSYPLYPVKEAYELLIE